MPPRGGGDLVALVGSAARDRREEEEDDDGYDAEIERRGESGIVPARITSWVPPRPILWARGRNLLCLRPSRSVTHSHTPGDDDHVGWMFDHRRAGEGARQCRSRSNAPRPVASRRVRRARVVVVVEPARRRG